MSHLIGTETAIKILSRKGYTARRVNEGQMLQVLKVLPHGWRGWEEEEQKALTMIDEKTDTVSRHALRDLLWGEKP